LCGWGNNELQWYRGAENFLVSDGTLKIIAKEEDFNNNDFTSARIRTLNKVDVDMTQEYIRLEARIKVPNGGKGLWPAFWMLPSDRDATEWPTGGEVSLFVLVPPPHSNRTKEYCCVNRLTLWSL